jgi:shikimate dehydrogenase
VQLANFVRDRTPAAATSTVWEEMYRVPVGTDLLVNAASIGLYPAKRPRFRSTSKPSIRE